MALVQQSYGGGATLVQHSSTTTTTTTTTMNAIPGGGSRLAQMQARFQQKQLQEKEQKLLRMFESQQQKTIERVGRGSAGSSGSSNSSGSTFGPGKVRQLFDERRGVANIAYKSGWDRSYPLEPLGRPAAIDKPNGHPKPARGASLDRTFTVLTTTNSSHKSPVGKVPVRRSKSQARRDDVDSSNNNQEVNDTHHNGYNYYQSFRTLPLEETHGHKVHDDNSNQLFRSEMARVEDMLSKQTLLDNEEPPEMNLVEEDDEPERDQQIPKEDEPERAEVISKLPNVGGPPRAPEEAAGKQDRDRYKTYNASNGHPGQEKRRLRAEPELRRTRDLETKKTREPLRQAQETRKSKETVRPQLDTTRSPTKTQMKSMTSSRPNKASGFGSPQSRTPASPTAPQPAAAKKQRNSTPVGGRGGGEVATSRSTPSRASAPRHAAAAASSAATKDDLVECNVCCRRFAVDRIQQHEQICNRTTKKVRKVFDPVKHRVQGTDAESYLRKIKAPPQKAATNAKKPDWRKKHEDFIATIRAAKHAQAHIAAGGKVSDLPPPPPSDYSDYVQCPHCSRRFNEQAAARHIPKCATMLHNKPKPITRAAPPKRR